MAQRVSPSGRVPGSPLAGVLRDLSRQSRTPRRRTRSQGSDGPLQALVTEVAELRSRIALLESRLGTLEIQWEQE